MTRSALPDEWPPRFLPEPTRLARSELLLVIASAVVGVPAFAVLFVSTWNPPHHTWATTPAFIAAFVSVCAFCFALAPQSQRNRSRVAINNRHIARWLEQEHGILINEIGLDNNHLNEETMAAKSVVIDAKIQATGEKVKLQLYKGEGGRCGFQVLGPAPTSASAQRREAKEYARSLESLTKLHDAGQLADQEFEEAKSDLLER